MNTAYTRDTNTPMMISRSSNYAPPPITRQRGVRESMGPETSSSLENNILVIIPQRQNAHDNTYVVVYEIEDEPTGGFN